MTERPFDREPIDCARLRQSPLLQVYLDGELPVADTLDVQLHLDRCPICRHALEEERAIRRRLRHGLPRVMPSSDLHERVRRIMFGPGRKEWTPRYFRWVALGTLGSVAVLALLFWGLRIGGSQPDLVKDLVSTHRLYSQVEAPAELASDSRPEVAAWIRRQLAFIVPVPDFSQAGLRLIGARLATHAEHPMAHLLYEKRRTLLSLYVFPAPDISLPRRGRTTVDGHSVVIRESAGHEVLLGRSGRFVFALVSTLDRDDLIECARTFLREHGQTPARAEAGSPELRARQAAVSAQGPWGWSTPSEVTL